MSKVDPVERWRVLYPHERAALRVALVASDYRPAFLRALSTSGLTEKQANDLIDKLAGELYEVERRPRPDVPWWDQ